jgi:hypothetical protein
MSYQELPVQMHVNYPNFVEFMKDCKLRHPPSALEVCFWVWYNARNTQDNERIDALKKDLDRLHRERDSFQEQARCLAESSDIIRDYAIWQAISDLERVCRHRTATAAEDWLQVEAENRTHIPTINYALEVLKACGVEMDSKIGFPNIRIIYDRSKNKFFGKV